MTNIYTCFSADDLEGVKVKDFNLPLADLARTSAITSKHV